jgi:hypothetical protein
MPGTVVMEGIWNSRDRYFQSSGMRKPEAGFDLFQR